MYIYLIFNLIIFITNSLLFYKFLHIFQLKNYNFKRYLRFFSKKYQLFILFSLILFIFELIFKNILFYIVGNIIFYILNIYFIKNLIKSSKTPLIFTKKLSRIGAISIIILFLLCLCKHGFLLVVILSPLLPSISNCLNIYDKIKNLQYTRLAQKKLKNHSIKIIAITGSNGKTSVKNILKKMLSTQHKVQATPLSYNTPLGIAKFINTELDLKTEYLILEYGARQKNDIKKLCKLYGADFGIVTTLSAQHIETFRSIESIFRAKKALPDFLQNKTCIFNLDNLYIKRMYNNKIGTRISVSTCQKADIYTSGIKIIDNSKTEFSLHIKNKSYHIKTKLLGKHNVLNICLATALAKHLNISNKNIISTIESLEPTEHRLSLIKTHINILDDSYNCSPASAKEALCVLKNFTGRKMVVTPGIIECGKSKYTINFNLGSQMAFCDFCVIVGNENKSAILEGIKKEIENSHFQPKILLSNSLEDAKQHFSNLNKSDTLLLLNDLPDDYH